MNKPTITVVGGAYGEKCCFPEKEAYRGSGGRAAATLSSLGASVSLSTVTGPQLQPLFKGIATYFGFSLDARNGAEDIWFRYRYPLGQPTIHPPSPRKLEVTPVVNTEHALVFGMIEGRFIVHAKRAVYDPQDGSQAEHFIANGSTAEDLALVVSHSEGCVLSGETEPSAIAAKLLDQPNVSVVVVKCGPQGALVKTSSVQSWVRAFPTERVYKIGSGDVFSAAFAFAWLHQEQDALSAAWFASRVAATYVESAIDKFDESQIPGFQSEAQRALREFRKEEARPIPKTQIYLAGPFFDTAQQWVIDELRGALHEMGFNVFSPVHDVGYGAAEDVAPADLAALNKSGLVLALLDGLDTGTIFEIGYARAKGIPVIAIAESVAANELTMITGSGCIVLNDLTTAIYTACWHLMGDV